MATTIESKFEEIIPKGTFMSSDELDEHQTRALQLVENFGNFLAESHPEVTEEYNKNVDNRYIDIAKRYIPEIAKKYPEVAKKSVGYAVRKLNSEEEQKEQTKKHRSQNLRQRIEQFFGGFDSEEFRKFCSEAVKKRNEIYGMEGLIRGKGNIPWDQEEINYALDLTSNKEYMRQSGYWAGKPNYSQIADELYQKFPHPEGKRSPSSVRNIVKRKSKRTKSND